MLKFQWIALPLKLIASHSSNLCAVTYQNMCAIHQMENIDFYNSSVKDRCYIQRRCSDIGFQS